MENKRQWLLTTTLFISLGLAACGSQSVLSQADANTQILKQRLRHLQHQLRRQLLILKHQI